MMQVNCSHCGAANTTGKVLCVSCGKAIMQATSPKPTLPIQPPSPLQAPRSTLPVSPPPPFNNQNLPQPAPPMPTYTPPMPASPGRQGQPVSPQTTYKAPNQAPAPGIIAPAVYNPPVNAGPTAMMPGAVMRSSGLAISRKTLFSAIAGGVGGIIPQVISATMPRGSDSLIEVLVQDFIALTSAGLFIGIALAMLDGLMARRFVQVGRDALWGAVVGFVGSLLALIFAEIVFRSMGATPIARQIAWVIFGAPFGAIEGFSRQSPLRLVLGIVGGALGGFVGGFMANTSIPLGFVAMGLLIGFFIGLIHDIFKQAWLKVMSGRSEGREVTLDRPVTVIGSGDVGQVDFGLYGDPAIVNRHIEIKKNPSGYQLAPLASAPVTVNGLPVTQSTAINNGDRIQLGNTSLVFLNRKQ